MAKTRDELLTTPKGQIVGKHQLYALLVDDAGAAILDAAGNEQVIEIKAGTDGKIQTSSTVVGSLANLEGALADVATVGERVRLPDIPCREITVIAKDTNTGSIYVGGSDVAPTKYGVKLKAEGSFTFPVANANQIYIDSSVSGEGISYVAI